MTRKRIFVVSSVEAMAHAKSFMRNCKDDDHIEYLPWWDQFQPGRTLIEELERFKRKLDGALIILTPDITASLEEGDRSIPNLNVLFEFGFFLSRFGRRRVAVVKYGEVFLPSDLDGVIPIYGGAYNPARTVRATRRTKDEFARWVEGFKGSPGFSVAGTATSSKRDPNPREGQSFLSYRNEYKLIAADFDAIDLDLTEPIDTWTRLRFTITATGDAEKYAFYFHFRTSANEQGYIGITNQPGEEFITQTERTSPQTNSAKPDLDIKVLTLIEHRWPLLKGRPVVIDKLRLRGDKMAQSGHIEASVKLLRSFSR
jgi:hypothetical protein